VERALQVVRDFDAGGYRDPRKKDPVLAVLVEALGVVGAVTPEGDVVVVMIQEDGEGRAPAACTQNRYAHTKRVRVNA
jgi:hypothetical protein